ncbi:hypothetical protein Ahy_A08g039249 [Arachis hypogaea]|uniref:DUF4283 domain-containing protein n=1 Tax=Arachis hypogaea TaxID=3818 RepID=A0A445BVQ7_ARAHY|nr:hypothetical protein Ahy_A08g039249 [Arachis hypogaea]
MTTYGLESIDGRVISFNKEGELGYIAGCLNLVGKVITEKETSFKMCKNALLGMWGNPQGVAVTDIGRKKLLFSFKDIKKGLQIVRNGPWNIRGNLINLQLWSERESVFDVNHDYMEFWIQVHGLPLDYMNKEIATKVGNMMGIVAEVENPLVDGILRRSFLRIKVGSSWKSSWRNEGEVDPAREQQHNKKESDDKQETGESAIRAEQCPQ